MPACVHCNHPWWKLELPRNILQMHEPRRIRKQVDADFQINAGQKLRADQKVPE
jgi:hypothetical protein